MNRCALSRLALMVLFFPVLVPLACGSDGAAPGLGTDAGSDATTSTGSPDTAPPPDAQVDASLDAHAAPGDGDLGIPKRDAEGMPIDVGLIVLGHSTSAQGDYPEKLARALSADGRSYVVFRAITGGDGGFLWTQLAFAPTDPSYARVTASQAGTQYCEDTSGTRWSCRRRRLEWSLTGRDPAPPECANVGPCGPARIERCVWHEGGRRLEEANVAFDVCLRRMDVKLALVQDTTNRSFPVDDRQGDGRVDDTDYFDARLVPAQAHACPQSQGRIGDSIDWNCDGRLGPEDAARRVYAGWLEKLAKDLLSFPGAGISHVFFGHKPVELGRCSLHYPGESCRNHDARTPTPSRPFDRFYLPTVYWEHVALDVLFASPTLDPRVHRATVDPLAMWEASAACYTQGMATFTLPPSSGRPTTIAADDSETDGAGGDADTAGCMVGDHVHHNDAGGFMMADVWYSGLGPRLSR